MDAANQMRVFLVIYAATGMFVSFMSGYALGHDELKDAKIDLILNEGVVEVEKARVHELRLRSADRDRIELDLRSCLAGTTKLRDDMENVKWQMGVVISTCPGRERPPERDKDGIVRRPKVIPMRF